MAEIECYEYIIKNKTCSGLPCFNCAFYDGSYCKYREYQFSMADNGKIYNEALKELTKIKINQYLNKIEG